MPPIVLRHIHRFRDRHGRTRLYLRLPGRKPVPLPEPEGSPAFMRAYQAAIEAAPVAASAGKAAPGSFDALALSWYAGDVFRALRPVTQRVYRGVIEPMRAKHGAKPVRLLSAVGVRAMMDEKAGAPTAANRRLVLLRLLMQHAIKLGWRLDDPTRDVQPHKHKATGFATWSEAEIAQYRAHHPTGSLARLAFELLLNTGQRRSDVVRMGPQHVRGGVIELRQQKTGQEVAIPILPELAAELAQLQHRHLTWLATASGASRSPAGFYGAFREWCDQAGIPPARSPHGLRKACGVRLAEAGCSAHQIMSILGHSTLKEAERYTAEANRRRMARDGMAKLAEFTRRERKA